MTRNKNEGEQQNTQTPPHTCIYIYIYIWQLSSYLNTFRKNMNGKARIGIVYFGNFAYISKDFYWLFFMFHKKIEHSTKNTPKVKLLIYFYIDRLRKNYRILGPKMNINLPLIFSFFQIRFFQGLKKLSWRP